MFLFLFFLTFSKDFFKLLEKTQSLSQKKKETFPSTLRKKTKSMYSVKKQTIHLNCETLFRVSPILLFYHAPALTVKKWHTLKRDLASTFSEKKILSLLLKRKVASLVLVNILKEDQMRTGKEWISLETPLIFDGGDFFQGPTLCFAISSLTEMQRLHRLILQSEARQSLLLGCLYQKRLFHTLETEKLLSLDSEIASQCVTSLSVPVVRFVSLLQQKQQEFLTLFQVQFLKTLKTLEQQKQLSGK